MTTSLGGPVLRDRLWFFTAYQHLRDYDSQPGTNPILPRTNKQDKIFAKVTWRLASGWQLVQSVHDEFWVNPEQPTIARPFETTLRQRASVPAVTFGHLTHTSSPNTVWEVRAGRFVYSRKDEPSTGTVATPNRTDTVTGIFSGAPPQFGSLTLIRTTGKATFNYYRPGLLGAVDPGARETDEIVRGVGTLYTWNVLSPRLGIAAKLSADGRTMLRSSYGRFHQGVLTGELQPFHPGATPVTTRDFVPAAGDYTRVRSVVDPRFNLQLDSSMRAPRTDEFSVGVDREVGRRLAVALAHIRKDGSSFIGWTDVGGQYRSETRTLPDGRGRAGQYDCATSGGRHYVRARPE